MASLVDDVSDVMRNLRKVTDFLRSAEAKNLTDADLAALRALVEELDVLGRIGDSFEQPASERQTGEYGWRSDKTRQPDQRRELRSAR